jgi:dTDP-4-dehydrorhamnose reductase
MTSRLLVFGGTGPVGRALIEEASGTPSEAIGLSHDEANICDAAVVAEAIRSYAPTSVVNAAAYTAVDKAESEPDLACCVNRDGARVVAAASAAAEIPLIHLSTDYVFDGRSKVPYTETDHVAPLGVYGRSKEEGERAVRESAPKHVILRTSWIYSPYGTNFVRTMLRLGSEHAELQVVDDQTGCPTSASDIATAIVAITKKAEGENFDDWGTYHFAGPDSVTWYGFAQLIFEQAAKTPKLSAISSAEYRSPAPRPAYSVLDTKKLGRTFGIRPRPLRESLAECLKTLSDP